MQRLLIALVLITPTVAIACSDDVEMGENGSAGSSTAGSSGAGGADASTTGGSAGASAAGGSAGAPACSPTACQGHIYQCGDCLDNDGDATIDSGDVDCLGPCDNTEDSYYGGIPGQNNAPCRQDCYFDQDTGTGNDECYWSHKCDPLSVASEYPPSGDPLCAYDSAASIPGSSQSCAELEQQQLPQCESYCGPLTPNGCDCFGCCELPQGSGKFVWLGSVVNGAGSCDLANVDDPTQCKPCTPVPSCLNGCAECELCIGKETLPDHCNQPDGGGEQCAPGVQACGRAGQAPCPAGTYCITGCCRIVPT